MMGLPPYSEMKLRTPWSPLLFTSASDPLPVSARREREDKDKRRRQERCGVRNTRTLRQWIGWSVVVRASALCSSSTSKLVSTPLFRLLPPIIVASSLRAESPFFVLLNICGSIPYELVSNLTSRHRSIHVLASPPGA
jgi:hypothetical protein